MKTVIRNATLLVIVLMFGLTGCTGVAAPTPTARPVRDKAPTDLLLPIQGDLLPLLSGTGSAYRAGTFTVEGEAHLYFVCSGAGSATVAFSPLGSIPGVRCDGRPTAVPIHSGRQQTQVSVSVDIAPEGAWRLTVESGDDD